MFAMCGGCRTVHRQCSPSTHNRLMSCCAPPCPKNPPAKPPVDRSDIFRGGLLKHPTGPEDPFLRQIERGGEKVQGGEIGRGRWKEGEGSAKLHAHLHISPSTHLSRCGISSISKANWSSSRAKVSTMALPSSRTMCFRFDLC